MLEEYFKNFKQNIIGENQTFKSPFGEKKITYADWTASGRMYQPLEDTILNNILPWVANTHTETNVSGTAMTHAYQESKQIIKKHVNADKNDVLVFAGSGMTGVVNKLQRILGFKYPENFNEFLKNDIQFDEDKLPVVFVSHMEHHSNQTSWLETCAIVEIIQQNEKGELCLNDLKEKLKKHTSRKIKIASITGCSNVTGIKTPYHEVAEIMHLSDGLCFVDFACSGPYVKIDMHPENINQRLDAIFLSPHKFLGGPGTSGVMVFNSSLYKMKVPDQPGGGTVLFTDPWGNHAYYDDIESREDGGTPPFLQGIRTALAVKLKEEMGIENILKREEELIELVFEGLEKIPNLHVLANENKNRLGIFSFYVENVHYNLIVKLLNDHFGIQTRGGCACAGTYGHILLNVNKELSNQITCEILKGNQGEKPGWIRMSIHPTMTNNEIRFITESIKFVVENIDNLRKDYTYNSTSNEFSFNGVSENVDIHSWFN